MIMIGFLAAFNFIFITFEEIKLLAYWSIK